MYQTRALLCFLGAVLLFAGIVIAGMTTGHFGPEGTHLRVAQFIYWGGGILSAFIMWRERSDIFDTVIALLFGPIYALAVGLMKLSAKVFPPKAKQA